MLVSADRVALVDKVLAVVVVLL
jgi:hypothetical protein